MIPSSVPHLKLNVIKSELRDEFISLVDKSGQTKSGADQASGLQGATSYSRNSLLVTTPNTDCHLSFTVNSSSELMLRKQPF